LDLGSTNGVVNEYGVYDELSGVTFKSKRRWLTRLRKDFRAVETPLKGPPPIVTLVLGPGVDAEQMRKNKLSIQAYYDYWNPDKKDYFEDFRALVQGVWQADTFGSGHTPSSFETTLYWNHLLATNDSGEVEIDFNTSQLPGTVLILIHGMSSEGAFSHQVFLENVKE
jgi:hypothetical protein